MTQAEVVTLLNDLSVPAPAALIDSSIRWEPIDGRSVRAKYMVGTNTISAVRPGGSWGRPGVSRVDELGTKGGWPGLATPHSHPSGYRVEASHRCVWTGANSKKEAGRTPFHEALPLLLVHGNFCGTERRIAANGADLIKVVLASIAVVVLPVVRRYLNQ